jgi:3-hydroxyisobutyrate dehydrogenase-like beta-hydroxyacid dehydrogenase
VNVGIVGLGIMGMAFARNLAAAGISVTGTDIDPNRKEMLAAAGGQPLDSAAAVAKASDVVLVAVASLTALDQVTQGLLSGARDDLIVVEMGTFPLSAKLVVRDTLEAKGARVIDAPVSGTGAQAADAQIVIYASGDPGTIEQAGPVFDAIGKATHDLGEFGNGSRMKYVANLLVSVHNLATAEAFVLGMKAGLDPQQILDVIVPGAGNSKIVELRGPMMVADDYHQASARLEMFIKDITVIGEYARELGVPTPLLDASLPFYEEGVAAGLGEEDAAALCRLLEQKAGFER